MRKYLYFVISLLIVVPTISYSAGVFKTIRKSPDGTVVVNFKGSGTDNSVRLSRKEDGNPVGTLLIYAGATVPKGYLLANGDPVSRATYAKLFSALGTTWGAGNGTTTFNLPDMRNRIPRGAGTSGDGNGGTAVALGAFQDDDTAPHNLESTISNHTHGSSYSVSGGNHGHDFIMRISPSAIGGLGLAASSSNSGSNFTSTGNASVKTGSSHAHSISGSSTNSGGHTTSVTASAGGTETRQKAYGVNYIIKS